MKNRILKKLRKIGRTEKQLKQELNITSFMSTYAFNKAFRQLKQENKITELIGGYYMVEVS